ncbi:phosphocholine cytidylyltransferase family protein [Candidatus Woesearchaeota archaeon]|nr:phosphocholine cytidylyltransferase family protein [Candidatus Woesearchaeota archaeon]
MKGIVIAAGPCKRLRPLTDDLPKCMLKIKGKSIIQNTIELFRNNGITDISVIRGYKKEKINFPGINYFENADFWNNNILHSLMCARPKIEEATKNEEDVVITYSDILYEDSVVKKLLESRKPIASIVDTDWQEYYKGRTDHPIGEAENVILDEKNRVLKIGKHIFTDGTPKDMQGEFIGLWKFTPEGARTFLKHFDRLNSTLKMTDPYQNTKEWQKSYITDIFQEMVDKKEEIYAVRIQKGWMEFDTVQDFKRIGGEIQEGRKI